MKRHYEGSIAALGTDEWSEPRRVLESTAKLAAEKILAMSLQEDEIEEDQAVNVCVRKITPDGIIALGEWEYFAGQAWVMCCSEVSVKTSHENKFDTTGALAIVGALPVGDRPS